MGGKLVASRRNCQSMKSLPGLRAHNGEAKGKQITGRTHLYLLIFGVPSAAEPRVVPDTVSGCQAAGNGYKSRIMALNFVCDSMLLADGFFSFPHSNSTCHLRPFAVSVVNYAHVACGLLVKNLIEIKRCPRAMSVPLSLLCGSFWTRVVCEFERRKGIQHIGVSIDRCFLSVGNCEMDSSWSSFPSA